MVRVRTKYTHDILPPRSFLELRPNLPKEDPNKSHHAMKVLLEKNRK